VKHALSPQHSLPPNKPSTMSACLTQARASLLRPFRQYACTTISSRLFSLSPRLLSTLAVLEHKEGMVSAQSFPAVTAASKFGGPITVFLAGSGSEKAAEQAAKLNGVEKVIYTSNSAYDKVLSSPPILGSETTYPLFRGQHSHSQPLLGITRELCASTRREYQEGKLYTCCRGPLSIWQKHSPTSVCSVGRSTGIRLY